MSITHVAAALHRGRASLRVRFLVDSGAVYSVLPARYWRRLGLKPSRTAEFSLADGSVIKRGIAECGFAVGGRRATSPVVLGEADDAPLLGAVTLETLGLMLNPLSREILPMPHTLCPLTAVL